MKITCASIALSLVVASSALAADLPARQAPPVFVPPPAFSWTGFYLGVWGGYAFGDAKTFDVSGYDGPPSAYNYRVEGGGGGATIGYNWQYQQVVFGFEGTAGYLALTGSEQFGSFIGDPARVGDSIAAVDGGFIGTATGRIGYAFGNALIYAKGGFAYGDLKASFSDSNPNGSTLVGTSTHYGTGYTVGGGVEYALGKNWSLKCEYQYYDFGGVSNLARIPGGAQFLFTHRLNTNLVTVGLNYKFDWAAPAVVAKY